MKKYDLDMSTPLDIVYGEKTFGSKEAYFRILKWFDSIFLAALSALKDAVNSKNFKQIKEEVHSIKGSAGYAGASWVADICYYIQLAFTEGRLGDMLPLYPKLIEISVQFWVYHTQKIAEYFNEPWALTPDLETVPIAEGYTLTKTGDLTYLVTHD